MSLLTKLAVGSLAVLALTRIRPDARKTPTADPAAKPARSPRRAPAKRRARRAKST